MHAGLALCVIFPKCHKNEFFCVTTSLSVITFSCLHISTSGKDFRIVTDMQITLEKEREIRIKHGNKEKGSIRQTQ